MIVAVTLLAGFGGWLISNSQASKTDQSAEKTTYGNRIEITPWGTLKVIKDKQGMEIFGKERPTNEGFSLSYQLLDPKSDKPASEIRTIYAIGDSFSGNKQEECEICQKNRSAAITKTKDGVLKITSNFYLDPKSGLLKISRYIENLSKNPVRMAAVRLQHAQSLSSDKPGLFGIIDLKRMKIPNQTSQNRPQPGISNALFSGFMPTGAFEPDIYCILCPPYCDTIYLTVSPSQSMYVCAKCDGNNVLQVDSDQGKIVTSANCTDPVKIEGWNGDLKGVSIDARRQLICLNCENSKVVPKALTNTSDAYIKELQSKTPNQCQLALNVDRGPRPTSAATSMKIPVGGTAEATSTANTNPFQ